MKKLSATVILSFGMAIIMSIGVQAAVSVCGSDVGKSPCVATGTVTKASGSTFFILGKNNVVYTVHADSAHWFGCEGQVCEVGVGDIVRVYGPGHKHTIQATRVRILRRAGSKSAQSAAGPEIKIVVEKGAGSQESVPSLTNPAVIPAPDTCPLPLLRGALLGRPGKAEG